MSSFPLPVAILAGGLATRLGSLTERIPKTLLPVCGRPFLSHQIELLLANGITRIVLCVGHLGEMIRDEFGDGGRLGVELLYSFDGPRLLGTGGALRKARHLLGPVFYVLYGDSYLTIDHQNVAHTFFGSGKSALMTVFKNCGAWDKSNVWFVDGEIRVYNKRFSRPEMQHIDYGLSILSSETLDALPDDEPSDLADLLSSLAVRKELAGHEAARRFYEIGSLSGLQELEDALMTQSREVNRGTFRENTLGKPRP
jgi:NDP-sugar pyrophosphorylase family protein